MKKNSFRSNILIILAVFTFYIPVIPYSVYYVWASNTITCEDVSVPYTTSYIDDDTTDLGKTYVKVEGKDGLKNVCKNKRDVVTSDVTTRPFVEQVNAVGTREEPYEPYVAPPAYFSGGSTCNDGVWTPATGRGTCSWHGGVAY
jgi:hypothetical protein